MKLYYTPGVCSLSPHIVLCEAGYDYTLEKVDIMETKKTESGADFYSIHDRGAVPFIILDNGESLSEGTAIIQYLADQKPESKLAPENGTMERTRLHEWLSYISTEMHKTHFPLFFREQAGDKAAEFYLEKLKKEYSYVSGKLEGKEYLMGDQFTVADAYMFTVINWSNFLDINLSPWPVLVEYQKRIAARPAVQKAMQAEGLLEQAVA